MRRAGADDTYGGEERCTQGFMGKPKEERPLGRPRCRWDGNIKVGSSRNRMRVDWIDLVEDRDNWRAL